MDIIYGGLEKLGHLFYVVNPFKTSFRTTAEVPHYVSDASLWFFALIIMEYVILYKKRRKLPPINDGLTSIACGMFMEVNQIAFKGAQTAAYVYIYTNHRIYELPWDSIWTWIACVLGMDLGYYWAHRAAHEVNLFWSQHQVHHSSEEYNLTTALRQGIWQGWATFMFYLPMAFFIPPSQFFVHSQFNLLYQFWIHTEVIDNIGPLELVLNTPSHHRVHHGSTKYCIDKNYAGVLIIWDRMFGTFEPERKEEPMVYGIIDQVKSFNPFYLEFFYLGKVYEKMSSVTGLADKFKAVFYGPGWFPGTPRLGNLDDLPDTTGRDKFSRSLTTRMQIYAGVHFLILSELYRYTAGHYNEFEAITIYIACAYIIVSLISLGLLFNQSNFFPWLEMIRCLFFIGSSLFIPLNDGEFWLKVLIYAVRIFHLQSAWMCQYECVKSYRAITFDDVNKAK